MVQETPFTAQAKNLRCVTFAPLLHLLPPTVDIGRSRRLICLRQPGSTAKKSGNKEASSWNEIIELLEQQARSDM
jgi:hypothetical protein